jgi:WD40 repeat protein
MAAPTLTGDYPEYLSSPNYECVETRPVSSPAQCIVVGNGLICTGNEDGTIAVLSADTKEHMYSLQGKRSVTCLLLLPDNELASGDTDGNILLFDLSSKRKFSHSFPAGHTDRINCLVAVTSTNDTTLVVSCSEDETARVWDTITLRCTFVTNWHNDIVTAIAVVPGNLIASSGYDRTIVVWNPSNGERIRTIQHAQLVADASETMVFVPVVNLLASNGTNGSISLWDLETGELKFTFDLLDGHPDWGPTCQLAVVPGTHLMFASCYGDKNAIQVWDVITRRCLQILRGHTASANNIAVEASTDSIISVSEDNTLKVWTNLKAVSARARARCRYCVLACLSRLTVKLYAGSESDSSESDSSASPPTRSSPVPPKSHVRPMMRTSATKRRSAVAGDGGCLRGVLAFDSIASADVWRYILEFV